MQFHSLFHQGSVSWCHTSCSCAALTAIVFVTEIFMRSYPNDGLLWFKGFLINPLEIYANCTDVICVANVKKYSYYLYSKDTEDFSAFIKYTSTSSPQTHCPDHLWFKWKHTSLNQGAQGTQQLIFSIVKHLNIKQTTRVYYSRTVHGEWAIYFSHTPYQTLLLRRNIQE